MTLYFTVRHSGAATIAGDQDSVHRLLRADIVGILGDNMEDVPGGWRTVLSAIGGKGWEARTSLWGILRELCIFGFRKEADILGLIDSDTIQSTMVH